jgi:hypothetical protein
MLLNLIFIFNLIVFSYFLKLLFKAFFYKSTDINQYKILNGNLSAIIILGYIFLIIIGLYIYRLLRMGNTLDLKLLLVNYKLFVALDIPFIFKFYFILHLIIFILLFMFLILNVHKYACRELFKVYLFINYKSFLDENKYTKVFHNYLRKISCYNLLTFILDTFTFKIVSFLKDLETSHGAVYNKFEMPKYKFSQFIWSMTNHRFFGIKHIYTFDIFLYYFIPLILIMYDCCFHKYELTYIFYYLPFIMPIILIQRITKTVGETDNTILDLIWEMYYKKETCIYACTKEENIILDAYILNGIQYLPGLALVFLHDKLSVLNNSPLHFKPIREEYNINMYQNDFGDCAQKLPNGDFMIVIDYLLEDDIKKYGGDEKPFIQYGDKLTILLEKKYL